MTLRTSTAYPHDSMRVFVVAAAVPTLAALALLTLAAFPARAQHDDARLSLMREPIAYTDVIDAADGADRLDLSVQLAFERLRDRGSIYREQTSATGAREQVRVARSDRELSRLALGFELGVFRDVMAFARLPLILADARALRSPSGVAADVVRARLDDAEGTALFSVPFAAESRAGLDYLALGGAWSVRNQMRGAPATWVLRIEGRRALTDPLNACRRDADATRCGSTRAEDRDGDGRDDGTANAGASAGSSEGLSALLLETRFSRRYRGAEPYAGLGMQVSWPTRATRAFRGGRPASEGSATLGTALIPWEDRGSYQRFALDLRLDATYVSRGLAYSALFDALGTSASTLARPRYPAGACVEGTCDVSAATAFRGVTEVDAHVRYGGQLGVELQAARYVRFAIGASLHAVTSHGLTGRDACVSGQVATTSTADGGSGCVDGAPELGHRAAIDGPGRRFFMRDELLLGGYAHATAMF